MERADAADHYTCRAFLGLYVPASVCVRNTAGVGDCALLIEMPFYGPTNVGPKKLRIRWSCTLAPPGKYDRSICVALLHAAVSLHCRNNLFLATACRSSVQPSNGFHYVNARWAVNARTRI